jgi:hypothetical protein
MDRVEFFATHGFLVLRGVFGQAEAVALRAEILQALSANYELSTEAVSETIGVTGFYLPMVGPRTPASRAWMADPRIMDLARELLGSDVIPKPAKGVLYREASSWHADSYDREFRAVKVVAYLDPLTAGTGSLRVLPGSHHMDVSASLSAFRASNRPGAPVFDEALEELLFPGISLDTQPGDVIFFDANLWHASLCGRDRVQWSASYVASPVTEREEAVVRDYIVSFVHAGHEYDTENYPYFDPDWCSPDAPAFAKTLTRICSRQWEIQR